jgi:hypothetical protein
MRILLVLLVALAAARPVTAGVYTVPGTHATLQAAINSALVSGDADNAIYVTAPRVSIGATLVFTDNNNHQFGTNHRLTVAPASTLARATIEVLNPATPAIALNAGGYVTFQDLDILRNISNAADLISIDHFVWGVFDRCRLGSVWNSPGDPGKSIMRIVYPNPIMVRDCMLFAAAPGTFDNGILAFNFTDVTNALYLYNDDVSNYRLEGIHIQGGIPGSLALLRNNVVMNDPALTTEPTAYVADCDANITVLASHNVAYASGAHVETNLAVKSIAGLGADFEVLSPTQVTASFAQSTWTLLPPWDPNANFLHLTPASLLHDSPADYGQTVWDGFPTSLDIAVIYDIDGELRNGGVPQHMDRGADQLDAGVLGVNPLAAGSRILSALPERNPSSDFSVVVSSGVAGPVVFEVFDLSGRRLYRAERTLGAGDRSVFRCPGAMHPGLLHYRARLLDGGGATATVNGSLVIVR